jgi:6-phosphogluconolactonase
MKSRFTFIFIIPSLLALAACGGDSSPAPTPIISPSSGKYLYVVNSSDGTVSGFSVAPTGELTAVAGSGQSALIQASTGIAANAASGKLYVGSSTSRSLTTFSADLKTGKLSNPTPLPALFFNSPSSTNAANLSLCGSILYGFGEGFSTRPGSPTISQGWSGITYFLLPDGSIDPTRSTGFGTFSASPVVSNGFFDSSCKYLFHVDTGNNTATQMTLDLTNNSTHSYLDYATGSAPVWVSGDPNAKFIYTANSGSNDVSAFSTDLISGTLTPVVGSPFPAGLQPSSVIVVQGWLYVANAADNTVSAFTWNQSTGALTAVPGSPFAVGTRPVAFATTITDLTHSPSGMLLYVANQNSNNVSAFTIDASGALHPVVGSPFAVGNAPKGMTVLLGPQ